MLSLRKNSRKEICPRCGRKTFTPYVDEANVVFHQTVGRCDRQVKCRYHLSPSEFKKQNGWKYDNSSRIKSASKSRTHAYAASQSPRIEVAEPSVIPSAIVEKSMAGYENNNLVQFMCNRFSDLLPVDYIREFLKGLGVGTSKKFGGSTVFWLADQKGKIRDGKIMKFSQRTCKRVRNPYPMVSNAHTAMDCGGGNWRPCFYLANLADKMPDLPIWLFESEKAAVICALAFEWGGTWLGIPMATGGCSSLNPTPENMNDPFGRLQVLKGRKVVLFPDEGNYDDWNIKGRKLAGGFCEEVYISTSMEKSIHDYKVECEINPGDGFDDLILRYVERGLPLTDLLLYAYSWDKRLEDDARFYEDITGKSVNELLAEASVA